MSETRIRHARPLDLPWLCSLWRMMLVDIGKEVRATNRNIESLRLLATKYMNGDLSGSVLVCEHEDRLVGVLMWGQPGDQGLDLIWNKMAVGFGTYLEPEYRDTGLSHEMWEMACKDLHEQGVDVILVHPYEKGVKESVERCGFHLRQYVMVKEL